MDLLQASLGYRVSSKTAKIPTHTSLPPLPFSTEVIGLVSTETEAYKTQYIVCGIEDVEAGGLLQFGSQHELHIETYPTPNKNKTKANRKSGVCHSSPMISN